MGVIFDDFGIVVKTALGHRTVVGGHGRFNLSGAISVPGEVATEALNYCSSLLLFSAAALCPLSAPPLARVPGTCFTAIILIATFEQAFLYLR